MIWASRWFTRWVPSTLMTRFIAGTLRKDAELSGISTKEQGDVPTWKGYRRTRFWLEQEGDKNVQ